MIRRSGLTRKSGFTKNLPDSFKSTDISGDKVVETLPPSFDIMKKGKPFNIERPQFKTGISSIDVKNRGADISKLNKRSGLGNNTILRDSFRTPDVLGRQPVDFALAEMIDRQQQGIKVQLSDKTLRDMFQVKTVDPTDLAWIAEYNRRIAAGETKEQLAIAPPFGREQRVMFKRVNFGSGVSLSEGSSLSISEDLKLLRDAVTAGSGSSDLAKVMAKVIELTEKFEAFTEENVNILAEILNKTKVIDPDPVVYFGAGYHRIWSKTEVENSPILLPFLLANVPSATYPLLSPSEPIIKDGSGRIKVKAMLILLSVGTRVPVYDSSGKLAVPVMIGGVERSYVGYANYLDINTRTVITRDQAIALVSGIDNVDNGMLDGLPPPSILTTGGVSITGKWNNEMEDSASDAASKASTSKMPPPEPKPPKPEPPPPEPSGSEPRDPSTKRKGKLTKAITDLRAKMVTGASLPVLETTVNVYSEENPDTLYKTYDVSDARTKEMARTFEIYKVGSKWYRKGS